MQFAQALEISSPAQSAVSIGAFLPPMAEKYIEYLRTAFRASAARRIDCEAWRDLEVATALELTHLLDNPSRASQPDFVQSLSTASEKLFEFASRLLSSGATSNGRANSYRMAVENVRMSAAPWAKPLDSSLLAYCRLAALIWITLWHVSDTPAATPALMSEYLKRCWPPAPDNAEPALDEGSRLSKALRTVTAALRKGEML